MEVVGAEEVEAAAVGALDAAERAHGPEASHCLKASSKQRLGVEAQSLSGAAEAVMHWRRDKVAVSENMWSASLE